MHDRFQGYKHVHRDTIRKYGCWCLRHIKEGILALIIANQEVDFGDDEAIQIEYIVCKKNLNVNVMLHSFYAIEQKKSFTISHPVTKNLMIGKFMLLHQ